VWPLKAVQQDGRTENDIVLYQCGKGDRADTGKEECGKLKL